MHTPIVIICQNQISARGMGEAMLNVLFHLLSQQQTRISCDRYMIVVKETEMKCMYDVQSIKRPLLNIYFQFKMKLYHCYKHIIKPYVHYIYTRTYRHAYIHKIKI